MTDSPVSSTTVSGTTEAKRRPVARPKVPPFARYPGTSAWRSDKRRVRAYAMYLAKQKAADAVPATPAT